MEPTHTHTRTGELTQLNTHTHPNTHTHTAHLHTCRRQGLNSVWSYVLSQSVLSPLERPSAATPPPIKCRPLQSQHLDTLVWLCEWVSGQLLLLLDGGWSTDSVFFRRRCQFLFNSIHVHGIKRIINWFGYLEDIVGQLFSKIPYLKNTFVFCLL